MEIINTGEIPPPARGISGPDTGDLRAIADEALKEAREKWQVVWAEGEKFVKQHPGKAVLAALGAGFLLGILLKD